MVSLEQDFEYHREQLKYSEFDYVQLRCGHEFDYDACCNYESGSDSKCSGYGSHGSFLEADVAGKHIWINAPFAHMHSYIDHYLACKVKDPQHTSACIVVPKGAGHWKPSLVGMQLLHEYNKGECLFAAQDDSAAADKPPLPCATAVQVYYDPPAPQVAMHVMGTNRLTTQFDCAVAGVPGTVLLDSGAEDQFISEAFARRVGIRVDGLKAQTDTKVVLPDGSSVPVLGQVRVKVSIQSFSGFSALLGGQVGRGFQSNLRRPLVKALPSCDGLWLRYLHAQER